MRLVLENYLNGFFIPPGHEAKQKELKELEDQNTYVSLSLSIYIYMYIYI